MSDKLKMYFDPAIARDFAEHEQNEKNFQVADAVDQVIMYIIKEINSNFQACELGGGAHPDRYHRFFEALVKHKGKIDWIDISPYMLELAKEYISTDEYKDRLETINFIENDILGYLESITNEYLNLAIMKYTIDHIADLDQLFALLEKKLKKGGSLVASIGMLKPELKSLSTNARYLYNGKEFPLDETKTLKDGDTFTVKFLQVSGKLEHGYMKGGETTKYYHSEENYKNTAKKYGFECFLGTWKALIEDENNPIKQEVLVLTKSF